MESSRDGGPPRAAVAGPREFAWRAGTLLSAECRERSPVSGCIAHCFLSKPFGAVNLWKTRGKTPRGWVGVAMAMCLRSGNLPCAQSNIHRKSRVLLFCQQWWLQLKRQLTAKCKFRVPSAQKTDVKIHEKLYELGFFGVCIKSTVVFVCMAHWETQCRWIIYDQRGNLLSARQIFRSMMLSLCTVFSTYRALYTRAHMYTHTRAHVHKCKHTHTHIDAHINTHRDAQIHTHRDCYHHTRTIMRVLVSFSVRPSTLACWTLPAKKNDGISFSLEIKQTQKQNEKQMRANLFRRVQTASMCGHLARRLQSRFVSRMINPQTCPKRQAPRALAKLVLSLRADCGMPGHLAFSLEVFKILGSLFFWSAFEFIIFLSNIITGCLSGRLPIYSCACCVGRKRYVRDKLAHQIRNYVLQEGRNVWIVWVWNITATLFCHGAFGMLQLTSIYKGKSKIEINDFQITKQTDPGITAFLIVDSKFGSPGSQFCDQCEFWFGWPKVR